MCRRRPRSCRDRRWTGPPMPCRSSAGRSNGPQRWTPGSGPRPARRICCSSPAKRASASHAWSKSWAIISSGRASGPAGPAPTRPRAGCRMRRWPTGCAARALRQRCRGWRSALSARSRGWCRSCSTSAPMCPGHRPASRTGSGARSSRRSPAPSWRPTGRCCWCSTTCSGATSTRWSGCTSCFVSTATPGCSSRAPHGPEGLDRRHPLAGLVAELEHARQLTSVELGPLDAAATSTLAGRVAGRPLKPEQAQRIQLETEGNPLFVVEMVRAGLVEAGESGGRATHPAPDAGGHRVPPGSAVRAGAGHGGPRRHGGQSLCDGRRPRSQRHRRGCPRRRPRRAPGTADHPPAGPQHVRLQPRQDPRGRLRGDDRGTPAPAPPTRGRRARARPRREPRHGRGPDRGPPRDRRPGRPGGHVLPPCRRGRAARGSQRGGHPSAAARSRPSWRRCRRATTATLASWTSRPRSVCRWSPPPAMGRPRSRRSTRAAVTSARRLASLPARPSCVPLPWHRWRRPGSTSATPWAITCSAWPSALTIRCSGSRPTS